MSGRWLADFTHDFDSSPDPAQLRTLSQQLQPEQDMGVQFEGLSTLCHILSMATEETLSNFSVDTYLPLLVNLLNMEHNPDMMLLACRALTHMMDIIPGSVAAVVAKDVPESLCAKLLNIEYIDLAEQSIQALYKISIEHPHPLIKSGAMVACLSYIDFFPIGVQRVASSIVANTCRQLPHDQFSMIEDSLPLISNLLHSPDSKIVENACLSYYRIVESNVSNVQNMGAISRIGVVSDFVNFISTGISGNNLSSTAFLHIIRTLGLFVLSSVDNSILLLNGGIAPTLRNIISAVAEISQTPATTNTPLKSAENLYELLNFADRLLPSLPQSPLSTPSTSTRSIRALAREVAISAEESEKRREIFSQHPLLVHQYTENILPVMMKLFGANVNANVRYKCLIIIQKSLTFCTPASLTDLLKDIPISSFTSTLLGLQEWQLTSMGLDIAQILMEKLPAVFLIFFEREGVFYEINRLSSLAEERKPSESDESSATESEATTTNVSATPTKQKDKKLVIEKAVRLSESYKSILSTQSGEQSDGCVQKLIAASESLKSSVQLATQECIQQAETSLNEIFDLLSNPMDVSAHELITSGLVDSLTTFLTQFNAEEGFVDRHTRIALFLKLASQKCTGATESSVRLLSLVQKIHGIINKAEKLSVYTHDIPANEVGFKILSRPFKLKFVKASAESNLGECHQSSVSIDPFATIQAIDDYLWSQVKPKEVRKERRSKSKQDDASEASSSSKSEGANPPSQSELSGTQVSSGQLESSETKPGESMQDSESRQNEQGEMERSLGELVREYHRMAQMEDENPGDEHEQDQVEESEPQEDEQEGEADEGENTEPASQSGNRAPNANDDVAFDVIVDEMSEGNHPDPTAQYDPRRTSDSKHPALSFLQKNRKLFIRLQDDQTGRRSDPFPYNIGFLNALQIFYKDERLQNPDTFSIQTRFWGQTHTIAYDHYKEDEDTTSAPLGSFGVTKTFIKPPTDTVFDDSLELLMSDRIEDQNILLKSLRLLSVIRLIESSWKTVHSGDAKANQDGSSLLADGDYHNPNLTAKANRQLQDIVSLSTLTYPPWCNELMSKYPLAFPFEIRRAFFNSTSIGVARSVQHFWKRTRQTGQIDPKSFRASRISRQKVRVSRDFILPSAKKVIDLFGSTRLLIEVEYYNEVGIGLGPSAEFYTLVSRELRKRSLGLWIEFDKQHAILNNPKGLFPRPYLPTEDIGEVLGNFSFMGTFVAKSIMDGRLLDLPFSVPFYKLLLGKSLSVYDAPDVDEYIGKVLLEANRVSIRKRKIIQDTEMSESERQSKIQSLTMFESPISSLLLDFTFPGIPNCELKESGSSIVVTHENIDEYTEKFVDMLFGSGIEKQLKAFREGFSKVIPLANMAKFTPKEFDCILNGVQDQWDRSSLVENLRCDHGYSMDNSAVKMFVEIMLEMNAEQQQAFVTFVTGCPKLPVGGLSSLNPQLTIVRKYPDSHQRPDDILPSVSTCFHYVKLPAYSSKEVMRQRLTQAMTEGQGNFHLS